MNAPLLWIVFPGLLSVGLLLVRKWERLVAGLATSVALGLAGLALWMPVREQLFVGGWVLSFSDTLSVFGRSFTLEAVDRPALIVLYLTTALWFGAAPLARPGKLFVPLGLGMVALLTAAIAVEPFLYAALLIEMAVLASIPFLTLPGKEAGQGVLRYLTFQTLGVPFILLTGWMLTGVGTAPEDQGLVLRVMVTMGLGFAFLLAVFPFHSWIPMLAQEANPYSAAFVFLLLPGSIMLLGLGFLNNFAWLRTLPGTYLLLRSVGVLMVVTAGIWAAFQRHLGRMLAYGLILEIGFAFISIGLAEGTQTGTFLGIFFANIGPRGLALGVWALALAALRSQAGDLSFKNTQGLARRFPIAAGSLILAHFSLAGLPLLASFPIRLALLDGLVLASPASTFWVLIGIVGFMIGGFRSLMGLVAGADEVKWQVSESWFLIGYLLIGVLGLLMLGLFPQWFMSLSASMPRAFEQLVP